MKKILSICLSLVMACTIFGTTIKAENIAIETVGEYGDGVQLGEVYDGTSTSNLLDIDDFESLENYEEYLDSQGIQYKDIQRAVYQTASASSTTLKPSALYKFSLGAYDHAIQSFYINGSEIYISQHYKSLSFGGTDYEGNLILLSRCILNGGAFSIADSMLLRNVGHGQTLDMYTYGGNTYFLVSCGSYTPDGSDITWSTQIGRISYNPNTVVNNSSIKRLTYLSYANKENKSFGAVKRVDAALSTDKTKLLIWKRSQNGNNQFSVYNFATINQQLSNSLSNTVSFQGNTTLANACTFTFDNPSNMTDSVQGVELSNIANGIHSVYISSGNELNDNPNTITRFNTNGNFKKQVTIDDTGVWSLYGASTSKNVTAEIEGVKIEGNNLQFVLRNTGDSSQQVIAYINKSNLE